MPDFALVHYAGFMSQIDHAEPQVTAALTATDTNNEPALGPGRPTRPVAAEQAPSGMPLHVRELNLSDVLQLRARLDSKLRNDGAALLAACHLAAHGQACLGASCAAHAYAASRAACDAF